MSLPVNKHDSNQSDWAKRPPQVWRPLRPVRSPTGVLTGLWRGMLGHPNRHPDRKGQDKK